MNKTDIKKNLKRWESQVLDSVLDEIAGYIEKEFVSRIKVEVLTCSDVLVRFLCNISPVEMKVREKEVCLYLPKTHLADDGFYRVKLNPYPKKFYCYDYYKKADEERLPKPVPNRPGWWEYYGEF